MSITQLSPNVGAYRVRLLNGAPFSWAPGQYVELFVPSSPELALPYSIASAPDPERPREFELAIGPGSGRELLAGVVAGSQLKVAGPFGGLRWPPAGANTLMIGVGTGVAPLRALLQATLQSTEPHDLIMLSGHRSEDDILWRDELRRLSEQNPRFRYEVTLTQGSDAWQGRRGRVQEHALELAAALHEPTVFLCGSLGMVQGTRRLLEEYAHVPAASIFAEGY